MRHASGRPRRRRLSWEWPLRRSSPRLHIRGSADPGEPTRAVLHYDAGLIEQGGHRLNPSPQERAKERPQGGRTALSPAFHAPRPSR